MRKDYRRRIALQSLLHHFPRVYRGAIVGSAEHLDIVDPPIPVVEKQYRKHLVFEACQLGTQVFLDDVGSRERCAPLDFQVDDPACRRKDLIGSGRQVVPFGMASADQGEGTMDARRGEMARQFDARKRGPVKTGDAIA